MIKNKNIPYYIISAGIFVLLKFGYKLANNDNLAFLLKPTNKLIALITGSTFNYVPESGYFHKQLNIFIDKSCAGFNFWILTFLMLAFLIIKNRKTNQTVIIPLALIVAYISTIFVNTSRIFASIIIQNQAKNFGNQHIIHEAIGVITNLSFLILIYIIADKTLIKINK